MRYDLAAFGADLTPERPAIWFAGRWYTYAELNERATRLANRLAELGIAPGERVGILAHNHLAHFDLLFAAPKHGLVMVPFNTRLPVTELQQQFAEVRLAHLFCDEAHATTAALAFQGPLTHLSDYRDWLSRGSREPAEAPPYSADSTQMMLFTGGTTGRAKAAMISWGQIQANARGTALAWDLGTEDCTIQATPCFHAGLHVLSTPLLAVGGRVVLMPQFNPEDYLRLLDSHHATVVFMVPSMYRALADSRGFAAAGFRSLRWAISGGAPCPPSIAADLAARGMRLRQGYGLTEAGVNCFTTSDEDAAAYPDSVGRPMPHLSAAIRREDGNLCGPDEVGELTLSGRVICSGYYNAPEEWAQRYRDGWLWTGDLASQDRQGRYRIRGRRTEMYISGGENVYPVEVEQALSACRDVVDCAVLGVPHKLWGETGLAAVVLRPGAARDAEALRTELRTRLAGYKLPTHLRFYESLPRTGAGKLDKRELRRHYDRGLGPA